MLYVYRLCVYINLMTSGDFMGLAVYTVVQRCQERKYKLVCLMIRQYFSISRSMNFFLIFFTVTIIQNQFTLITVDSGCLCFNMLLCTSLGTLYVLYVCLHYIILHNTVFMACSHWWWTPDSKSSLFKVYFIIIQTIAIVLIRDSWD